MSHTLANIPANAPAILRTLMPRYPRTFDKQICHLGLGNFHRAHQAACLHQLLQDGLGDGWGYCAIGMTATDSQRIAQLKENDGLYSLWTCDDNTQQAQVCGSIMDFCDASEDRAAALARLCAPETRIVSLTITEKGYYLAGNGQLNVDHPAVADDIADPARMNTAIALIARALYLRREQGLASFTVQSCDNIISNGDVCRQAVIALSAKWDTQFSEWIADNVSFPNSMVDRITPAPDVELLNRLNANIELTDTASLACEPWLQWVIEDKFPQGRPDWQAAGVTFSNEVERYEQLKVGLLNGGHCALAIIGLLEGHTLVHEAMAAPAIRQRLSLWMQDCDAVLDAPENVDSGLYQQQLLQRFANSVLADRLERLAEDYPQKLQQCILPTLIAQLERDNSLCTTLVLALWYRYASRIEQAALTDDVPNAVAAQWLPGSSLSEKFRTEFSRIWQWLQHQPDPGLSAAICAELDSEHPFALA